MPKYRFTIITVACWKLFFVAEITAMSAQDSIVLSVQVLPQFESFKDFLSYPALLLLVLENNGVRLSHSGKAQIMSERVVRLERRTVIPFKRATAQFVERKNDVFIFDAQIEWELANTKPNIKLVAELDCTNLREGLITIEIRSGFTKLIPQKIKERIQQFAQKMLRPSVQEQTLAYLSKIGVPRNDEGFDKLLGSLLVVAYNNTPSPVAFNRYPGEAEPLSDQVLLIATLAIWLILGPAVYGGFILWRRRKGARFPR